MGFRAGGMVRCIHMNDNSIDGNSASGITFDKLYKVMYCTKTSIIIINDNDLTMEYMDYRFECISISRDKTINTILK